MFLNIKAYSSESFLKFHRLFAKEKRNETDIIYDKIRVNNKLIITFYHTLTIIFDGIIDQETEKYIDILIEPTLYFGIDEVGVGENIGPFVTCGLKFKSYADKKAVIMNGIKDSKKLDYFQIAMKAEEIKKHAEFGCIFLTPEQFNKKWTEIQNVKKINALAQNKIHIKFKQFSNHIVDQFVSSTNYFKYLKDEPEVFNAIKFSTKAEDRYPEVAAAAIICKSRFNEWVIEYFKNKNYPIIINRRLNTNLLTQQIISGKIPISNQNEILKIWKLPKNKK